VLSVPNRYVEEQRDEEVYSNPYPTSDSPDAEWDKSVCTMEMDRLTRLIDAKLQKPSLVKALREDISEYINRSPHIHDDIKSGCTPYKAILLQAAACIRRIILEHPSEPGAPEAFLFVADELERMDYITPEERDSFVIWLSENTSS
jgi:hypothetical protein